ncbi:MAG: hypothetical protein J3R72DRAFT_432559 [Linnemannia gamsii]|nr:MAG: hypothetical protein J3R72DRAFT_432559 [Linnemannia gamsii]
MGQRYDNYLKTMKRKGERVTRTAYYSNTSTTFFFTVVSGDTLQGERVGNMKCATAFFLCSTNYFFKMQKKNLEHVDSRQEKTSSSENDRSLVRTNSGRRLVDSGDSCNRGGGRDDSTSSSRLDSSRGGSLGSVTGGNRGSDWRRNNSGSGGLLTGGVLGIRSRVPDVGLGSLTGLGNVNVVGVLAEAALAGGDGDTEGLADVQVGTVGSELGVPLKEIVKGDAELCGEGNAVGGAGFNNVGPGARGNWDGDDGSDLGGGSEGENNGRESELHCEK